MRSIPNISITSRCRIYRQPIRWNCLMPIRPNCRRSDSVTRCRSVTSKCPKAYGIITAAMPYREICKCRRLYRSPQTVILIMPYLRHKCKDRHLTGRLTATRNIFPPYPKICSSDSVPLPKMRKELFLSTISLSTNMCPKRTFRPR